VKGILASVLDDATLARTTRLNIAPEQTHEEQQSNKHFFNKIGLHDTFAPPNPSVSNAQGATFAKSRKSYMAEGRGRSLADLPTKFGEGPEPFRD